MANENLGDNLAAFLATPTRKFGYQIFVGQAPESKVTSTVITDTGGAAPDVDFPLDNPSVQIAYRGAANAYEATYALALADYNVLNRKRNFTMGGMEIMKCDAIGYPAVVGLDEKGRWLVTCNYMFRKRNAAQDV